MYMIEIKEDKFDKLNEYTEKMLKYGGKLMQCLSELEEEAGMGQRSGGYGNRGSQGGGSYGGRYGERGGQGGGYGSRYGERSGYGMRDDDDDDEMWEMGERRGGGRRRDSRGRYM